MTVEVVMKQALLDERKWSIQSAFFGAFFPFFLLDEVDWLQWNCLLISVCVLVVVVPSSSSTSPSKKWNGKIKSWTKPAFWCSRSKGQQFNSLFLLFFLLLHVTLIYFPRESFTGRGREQRRNLTIYQLSMGHTSAQHWIHFTHRKKKKWTKAAGGIVQNKRGEYEENRKKMEWKKDGGWQPKLHVAAFIIIFHVSRARSWLCVDLPPPPRCRHAPTISSFCLCDAYL
jgi:hypothetical protein